MTAVAASESDLMGLASMSSLSTHPVDRAVFSWAFGRTPQSHLKPQPPRPIRVFPGPGSVIAIDAEFVSTATQEDEVLPDGTRVVVKSSRQAPGRVTVITDSGDILMDEYVEVPEPVVDFLTRYCNLIDCCVSVVVVVLWMAVCVWLCVLQVQRIES